MNADGIMYQKYKAPRKTLNVILMVALLIK